MYQIGDRVRVVVDENKPSRIGLEGTVRAVGNFVQWPVSVALDDYVSRCGSETTPYAESELEPV